MNRLPHRDCPAPSGSAATGASFRIIPSEAVDQMKRLLPSQSKDSVMDVLGISSNTWLKVKKAEPIRASVAERLLSRLGIQRDGH